MLLHLTNCHGQYFAHTLFKHFLWKNCAKQGQVLFCVGNTLNKNEDVMPKNPLQDLHSAGQQTAKGFIYDKKPFKMECVKDKRYFWCVCGKSKSQPLCDSTHKNPHLNIKLKPLRFTVTETKEYWLCNCKQTSNRPFCDGTHKREDIQAAVK